MPEPYEPLEPANSHEEGGVSKPDSYVTPSTPPAPPQQTNQQGQPANQPANTQKSGGHPDAEAAGASAESCPAREELPGVATRRWRLEGRDMEVAIFRDRARAEYIAAHPKCRRRDAHEYAWQAAIAAFPPAGQGPAEVPPPTGSKALNASPPVSTDSGRIQGLGAIPEEWGELPLNASLQAELSWVQAHRLYIVEELPSGATRVTLDRARVPAPSMAALGWLETSIRSYAKYIDVVSRSLALVQDAAEQVQRERLAIEEIRALLREMLDA